MIENYIHQIIKMEILADSICIIDTNGIIRYFKIFRDEMKSDFPIPTSEWIGKHFMSVFEGIKPEESTFLKALQGITTLNHLVCERPVNGPSSLLMESIYPIILNERIIGAACISRAADSGSYKALKKIVLKSIDQKKNGSALLSDFVGISPGIQNLKMQIMQLANFNANVLICGETGTGKEIVAEAIHSISRRQNKTFYAQNCAAIPSTLLESIFFGTEKGIYTGSTDRPGILELSDGGTVFLDEINSLNLSMQAKLLKALEDKNIRKLGSEKVIHTDFRVIAATNEDPFDCVNSGKMRSDLFYRLSSVILEIPPLRKRTEDIPILANHFIELCNKENEHQVIGLSPEVLDIFLRYPWPGNVRELKNAVESACIFANTPFLQVDDIPLYITNTLHPKSPADKDSLAFVKSSAPIYERQSNEIKTLREASETFEKDFLQKCLKTCPNHSKLAKQLDISRQTLLNKIQKYGL